MTKRVAGALVVCLVLIGAVANGIVWTTRSPSGNWSPIGSTQFLFVSFEDALQALHR